MLARGGGSAARPVPARAREERAPSVMLVLAAVTGAMLVGVLHGDADVASAGCQGRRFINAKTTRGSPRQPQLPFTGWPTLVPILTLYT